MEALHSADVRDLRNHVERLQAAGQSRRTITARQEILRRVARALDGPLTEATSQQLAGWLASNPRWSRKTKVIYLYHLQAYYKYLVKVGRMAVDPAAELDRVRAPKRPPRTVPEPVLVQILARARNPRWRLYIILAAFGGLRCEEITRLHTEDVTEQRMSIFGKGDKVRYVPTHPLIWDLVSALPAGPVCHFTGDLAAKALSKCGSAYLARIGFKGITMHRFRVRFGTATYRVKKNILATQRLLGHASVATTMGYVDVDDEELELAVRQLPAA